MECHAPACPVVGGVDWNKIGFSFRVGIWCVHTAFLQFLKAEPNASRNLDNSSLGMVSEWLDQTVMTCCTRSLTSVD